MIKMPKKKTKTTGGKCPLCGTRLSTQTITEGILAPRYKKGLYCPKCGYGRNNF